MKAMYMQAGVMPMGFALPILEIVQSFVNFFTADDAEDKDKDDTIVDDLDGDEDDSIFGKDEDDDEDKENDDSKGKKDSKNDSAIVQKQKYRDLYKKTDKELKELKQQLAEKPKDDTPDAKKEKEARDFLKKLIAEELDARGSKESEAQKELDEQLTELLEDNDDLTEKQILDVVEDLGVTPKQAVAAIRREQRASGTGKKAKPSVPRSKRGGDGTVEDKSKGDKPLTLEQASALAKKRLSELNNR